MEEGEPNWIMLPEKPLVAWMVVPGAEIRVPEVEKMGMPSPSPIRWVLAGKIQGVEIMIGLGEAGGRAPVAGSRMVEGGGFVSPAHGLAVQVMLVGGVLLGRPRASMTAPADVRMWFWGFRTQFNTEQKLGFWRLEANMLASMKAGEFVTCPEEL